MNLLHYSIIEKIGEGGMASVYSAEDKKFDTTVAIKVLNKELCSNENIRKRFLAEAKSLYKMSHANIVKVTDLIEDADTVAFVMEYIDGETLKQYIEKRGKLANEEIKDLFFQMLDAVGYVHDQQLIHRDIKPSNFMVNRQGRVKLMDFGIAKSLDTTSPEYTITHTSQQMGTPMYMSPEQVKSSKDVTLKTDIYSLGVVLWQMVSGKRPYDSSTLSNFEIQLKIFQEQLPLLNSPWDAVIQKATAKNELDRFKDSKTIKLFITDSKDVLTQERKSKSDLFDEIKDNPIKDDSTVIESLGIADQEKEQTENIEESQVVLFEISVHGGPDTTSMTRCPSCHWRPNAKKYWVCECGKNWDTFSTQGRCPKCNKVNSFTQCPKCEAYNNHSDWYIFRKLKYGFIDIKGNRVIEPKFDQVWSFDNDGYCRVSQNGKWGLIKRNGKFRIQPKFDEIDYFLEDGTAKAKLKNKWGIIDRKGNWIIEPNFDELGDYDSIGFCKASKNNQFGFINKKGEWKVQPRFDALGRKFDKLGYVEACKNGKWGFIRMNGDWKIQPLFSSIYGDFDEIGLCIVSVDDKWGVIDRNGDWVIKPVFDELNSFDSKGYSKAVINGKYGFIDRRGSWIIGSNFEELYTFGDDNLCSGKVDEKWVKIDRAGKFLFEPLYDNLGYTFDANGYCNACIDGKWGSIDRKGNWLISPSFDDEYDFDDLGFASVAVNQKWGWIDRKGNWIIQPVFDGVDRFDDLGLCLVYKNGLTGLINRSGRYLILPEYFLLEKVGDPVAKHENELYFKASKSSCYGIIDINGNWVIQARYDYYYEDPVDWLFTGKHIWSHDLHQWQIPETGNSIELDSGIIFKYFSHLKSSAKIYFSGDDIPQKKIQNFASFFNSEVIEEGEVLLYYDSTLFGKGDNGFLILNHNNRVYLFLSPYLEEKRAICLTDDGVNNYLTGIDFSEKEGILLTVQTQAFQEESYAVSLKDDVGKTLVNLLKEIV